MLGVGSERQMQLCRALPKQLHRFVVGTNQIQPSQGHGWIIEQMHERLARKLERAEIRLAGDGPLKIMAQGIECVLPCVALIRLEAMENAHDGSLAFPVAILNGSGQRGDVRKLGELGKK